MNLFRSEEHARNWSGFGTAEGLLPLRDLMAIFSTTPYSERLNGAYISNRKRYYEERVPRIRQITGNRPFWDPAPAK